MHWGLIPNWAQDPTIGNRMINARAESLTEKPAFKHLVGSRRCIIPADGFYEWRKQGKRKVPIWVYLTSRQPFGLAGLWDVWRKPDGGKVESFTIITTEPNELVRPVHNRMPVILPPKTKSNGLTLLEHLSLSQITVEALSRRADGCA
jgi:putative SOS response-associated peptidase YedK